MTDSGTRFGSSWDGFFFDVARLIATRSKDPKGGVGAVIVDERKRILGTGYNGFPRRTHDHRHLYYDQDYKDAVVIHAEENAISNSIIRPAGGILYTTYMPCPRCAGHIIQNGLVEVHSAAWPNKPHKIDEWRLSMDLLRQAGVKITVHPDGV